MFVKAGLTPLEALQTATINPAKFLGRTQDLGTIEKGKKPPTWCCSMPTRSTTSAHHEDLSRSIERTYLSRSDLDGILKDVETTAREK